MLFLDVLRDYLRGLESAPGAPARAAEPAIDLPAARRHFLEAAEAFERGERTLGARSSREDPAFGRDWSVWDWFRHKRGDLDSFLLLVAAELSVGLCAGADAEVLQLHVHQAVDVLLGLPNVGSLSRVRERELARVVEFACEAVEHGGGLEDIARYALEVRAIRNTARGTSVSSIGRVLLSLPEMDAIRWLLTLETLQSMGPHDGWRAPREALEAILRWPPNAFCRLHVAGWDEDAEGVGESWSFSVAVLSRCKALGIVSSKRENWRELSLIPEFRPMLEEVISQRRTPLSMLAESLIAEERGTVFGYALEAAPPREPASEIQARHARMVVHEIRNALVPVRMALTGVYRALDAHAPGGAWQPQQERIDRGLDRVFRFVDELQKIALLTTAPVGPFDVAAAIQDATTGLNGDLALDLQIPAAGVLPRLIGHRERFTLAIVNILRNAVQNSAGPRPLVRLSAAPVPGGCVVVTIEDDGPGVPEEHRERIFQQGFALRQGGSGQGLAMVREVVEAEMKGEVRCERGDLGGARFVLVLPMPAKESS